MVGHRAIPEKSKIDLKLKGHMSIITQNHNFGGFEWLQC